MGLIVIQVISLSYCWQAGISAYSDRHQQEVKQREAEANMRRAEADEQADAPLKLAEAEAKSIRIYGDALRQNLEVMFRA